MSRVVFVAGILNVVKPLLLMFTFCCFAISLHSDRSIYESLKSSCPTLQSKIFLSAVQPHHSLAVNDGAQIEITATDDQIIRSLVVMGEPLALVRHRSTRSGRMYNPSKRMQDSFAAACQPLLVSAPYDGPLEVTLTFHFSRPKYHYRSGKYSHLLKDSADRWHTKRGDLDNLVKFVLDALNGIAYIDDSQVAVLSCAKLYADADGARTEVKIRRLSDVDPVPAGNFNT